MGEAFKKVTFVADLVTGTEVTDFFMVKSSAIRVGANGKQYFDVMLGDKTGEVSSKKWDIQDTEVASLEALKEGDIVRVRANVTEWQSAKQLKIFRIRLNGGGDELDLNDFIKAAPERSEDMFAFIRGVASGMEDGDYRKLCLRVLDDNRDKLMYYPAASKNHHAMYGGLLFHTKRMLENALGVSGVYKYLNKDLLCAGVILHDIEKLEEIKSNEYGISPGYTTEGLFLGHLVMGVKYIDRLAEELGLPREKALMIEQMILSHHYQPEFGSPVRPLFPEGEVLHYLDILDARLFDMRDAVAAVDPGHFSDRIWTLDNRRVYKPLGDAEPDKE